MPSSPPIPTPGTLPPPTQPLPASPQFKQSKACKKSFSGLKVARVLSPQYAKKKALKIKLKRDQAALRCWLLTYRYKAYMQMAEE